MRISDWSSDVCSSDLDGCRRLPRLPGQHRHAAAPPARGNPSGRFHGRRHPRCFLPQIAHNAEKLCPSCSWFSHHCVCARSIGACRTVDHAPISSRVGAPMTFDQTALSAILICTLVLFVWGRWRSAVVAVLPLMAGGGVRKGGVSVRGG